MFVTHSHVLKLQSKLDTAATRIGINPISLFKGFWSFFCSKTVEQKAEEREKEQTLNLFLHDIGRTMSSDLSDYKIIKEGEAEILMHAKNEVFYNKTQVIKFAFLFFYWVLL